MATVVDSNLCEGCGSCEAVCPGDPNCYEIQNDVAVVVHPEACTECNECIEVCPLGAITMG